MEQMEKTNFQLRREDVVYLDRQAADMRDATGAVLNRSAIVRALLAALRKAGFPLREARSEEDLERIFRDHLTP